MTDKDQDKVLRFDRIQVDHKDGRTVTLQVTEAEMAIVKAGFPEDEVARIEARLKRSLAALL